MLESCCWCDAEEGIYNDNDTKGVLDKGGSHASSRRVSCYPIPTWIYVLLRASQGTCPPLRFKHLILRGSGRGRQRDQPIGPESRNPKKSPSREKQPGTLVHPGPQSESPQRVAQGQELDFPKSSELLPPRGEEMQSFSDWAQFQDTQKVIVR